MGSDRGLTTTGGDRGPSNLFEEMKNVNEHGAEYWSARDIMAQTGYKQWRRFENIVKKAITSCQQSGNEPAHHFASAGKPVTGGSGAVQVVPDFHLSRFACYLIAQNGDPRKPEIASAQKYFAIQTRRQELSDQALADNERLELREHIKGEFKALSGAARQAGVQDKMFGVFHDAGYKGLYAGRGKAEIKRHKKIPEHEDILDRMDSNELAMNALVRTQTREQLTTVDNQQAAIDTHLRVGQRIRQAVREIGGQMPENIPPAEHIKVVQKRIKGAKPKLKLGAPEAAGLIGHQRPRPTASELNDL